MKQPIVFETIAEAEKEWLEKSGQEELGRLLTFEEWCEDNEVFIKEVELDRQDIEEAQRGQY